MKKVKFDREMLHVSLSKSIKFVPKKELIPAQKNALFTIEGQKCTITTMGEHSQVTVAVPCSAKEDFSFCLDAKLTHKTISLMSENDVQLSYNEKKVTIKAGKSTINIPCDTMPENFPRMPTGTMEYEMNIADAEFKKALKAVSPFVSETENTNISLLNISLIEDKITFQASRKGCMSRVAVRPSAVTNWGEINIYPEEASAIASLLGDSGEVTVTAGDGKLVVFKNSENVMSSFRIVSQLANTKFPNVQAIFDRVSRSNGIMLNTAEFINSVRRLKLFVGETKIIGMSVKEGSLVMTAVDNMYDRDCEESVSVIEHTSEMPIQKMFNSDNLSDIVSSIEENEIWLYHEEANNIPCMIIPATEVKSNYTPSFLIAPTV